jgi:trans-aconitate 2-methyltransferase
MMKKYIWNAKDYEQHSDAQQKWARELLAKLNLKGTEDILDLGCGDGKVTVEIANQVPNGSVIGVDSARSMIEWAIERYPSHQYPNLSFMEMDATHLLFDERFDVVFSNAALHWVKNHQPIVQGLYRSLKPNGKILLQMGGKGNAKEVLTVLEELQKTDEWKPYFSDFEFPYGFYGIEEYHQLLADSKFSINRVELIPKEMELEECSGFEGWIRTTWLPYAERIPTEKRDQFIKAISKEYLKQQPIDSHGKVHVAMVRIEIEAEKHV